MLTEEQRIQRLNALMKINPLIDPEKHKQDHDACQQYLAGNKKPFQDILEEASEKTKKYVMHSAGPLFNTQDKEDIISQTLEAAISKMAAFKGWSRYSTWMKAIARYRIYNFVKIKTKEIPQKNIETAYQSRPTQEINIFEMLSSLPKIHRLIVQYHAIDKWTIQEIAAELNIPKSKVRKHYKEAISQLRQES
jgi:RNA polymerase sigma factor (sigma-70 family)